MKLLYIIRATIVFVVVSLAAYLETMCAIGFNDPKIPVESTVCVWGLFVFPALMVLVLLKLFRKWRNNVKAA